MNRTKVALIGCGKQAPKHISGLRKIPGVDIVVVDVNESLARRLAEQEGVAWASHVDAVFADDSVDAVDICTPTPTHASLIHRAIERGKDFFCEKPLCEGLADARDLARAVEISGRVGMIGYIYRFAPVFEKGLELLQGVRTTGVSPVLGRVVLAHFRLGGRGSHQLWKHQKASGGGAINEMLVHMVDLAIWFFGPVQKVSVLCCDILRPHRMILGENHVVDAEDNIQVRLEMKNGIVALCQADLLTPAFTQFVEIQGDEGTFWGSIQSDMPSFLFCNRDRGGYPAGKTMLKLGGGDLFEAQMAEFVSAVREGRPPSRSSVHDSVALMEVMEQIRF
ncbi:Gfo/Idh/MocA family protein [Thiovibrio sp. JS02]